MKDIEADKGCTVTATKKPEKKTKKQIRIEEEIKVKQKNARYGVHDINTMEVSQLPIVEVLDRQSKLENQIMFAKQAKIEKDEKFI